MLLNIKIIYFVLFKVFMDGYKFLVYIIVLCFKNKVEWFMRLFVFNCID